MSVKNEAPQWAIERACALANGARSAERHSDAFSPSACDRNPSLHAFACYIAEHEEPPVDPLREMALNVVTDLCAKRGYTGVQLDAIRLGYWCVEEVEAALEGLHRGRELAS